MIVDEPPDLYVVAGPNGSGKSTLKAFLGGDIFLIETDTPRVCGRVRLVGARVSRPAWLGKGLPDGSGACGMGYGGSGDPRSWAVAATREAGRHHLPKRDTVGEMAFDYRQAMRMLAFPFRQSSTLKPRPSGRGVRHLPA